MKTLRMAGTTEEMTVRVNEIRAKRAQEELVEFATALRSTKTSYVQMGREEFPTTVYVFHASDSGVVMGGAIENSAEVEALVHESGVVIRNGVKQEPLERGWIRSRR